MVSVQASKNLQSMQHTSLWRGAILATAKGKSSLYLHRTRYVFLENRGSIHV
ncbi:hypothetical protein [Anaerosinus massiliensis]|uniref:hypothetical protein n=1 Tax=Massilibacillus massiliensis TaxID=1806837 RepID=UPI0018FEF7A5|nr:hypothetical protein [Massilibacillus massiliensis]